MALIRCKECKAKVSTSASACPKCGATGDAIAVKEPTKADKIAGGLFFSVFGAWCLIMVFSPEPELPSPEEAQAISERVEPEKVLARALENDPQKWLETLSRIKPDEHSLLLADRDASVERLFQDVRAVPASDVNANMVGYAKLVALQPQNAVYEEKWRHYRNEVFEQRLDESNRRRCDTDERQLSYSAVSYSRGVVKQQLKAPRSANFNGPSQARYLGNCEFTYTASVDSQNGFGAMIRTNFTVKAKAVGTSWVLTDISL